MTLFYWQTRRHRCVFTPMPKGKRGWYCVYCLRVEEDRVHA